MKVTKEQLDNYEGDKRSKGYKKLKAKYMKENASEGLGDTVEKVLRATGIKTIYNFIVGEDCKPCDDRRRALNSLLPYGVPTQVRWFTEEESIQYGHFFNSRLENSWQPAEVTLVFKLYAEIFNKRYNIRKMCGSCMGTANILRTVTGDLDRVYNDSLNN